MTFSLLSLIIALALVIAYVVACALKGKGPNLGVLFALFVMGPAIDESFDIMAIVYRLAATKPAPDPGVFKNHVFVIAFSSIALLYAAGESVYRIFRPVADAKRGPPTS
jgi:hypothetical protein